MLYGSETWPLTIEDTKGLVRNHNSMVRWICSVRFGARRPVTELCRLPGLQTLPKVCRGSRLRWFGHLKCMEEERWPGKILDFDIVGSYPRGRPKKRWSDNIHEDLQMLGLQTDLALNRSAWQSAIQPPHTDQRTSERTHPTPVNRESRMLKRR